MKTLLLPICFLLLFTAQSKAEDEVKFASMVKLESWNSFCAEEKHKRDKVCKDSSGELRHYIFEQPDESSKSLGYIKPIEPHSFPPTPNDFKWVKVDGNMEDFHIDGIRSLPTEYNKWMNGHTYIGCKGNWHKLPRNPFPKPVWVRFRKSCLEVRGVNEANLKHDLTATEVGSNRKVLLPAGKLLITDYVNGKVILHDPFTSRDISDTHPDVQSALKYAPRTAHESDEDIISEKKDEILNEYFSNGKYKASYTLEMKDFLDKDSHLQLTELENAPTVEAVYLDNKSKSQNAAPKKP